MIFQGAGNKYWKPNLNDPSQVTGASISGIANWYGQPLGGSNGATGTGTIGVGGVTTPGSSGNVAQLTQLINEINQAAQQKANAGRIPGGAALEGQSSANIGSALAGEVDPSTINLIGQQAAERGVMSGNPLGASNNAAYLRALGLTSMDRMNTGQNWLSAATARNPAAPIYDAGKQFLTAEQQQQAILAREEMANRLRIAQMHYANRGGGGGGSYGRGATTPGISSSSSNWVDRLVPTTPAAGWNFPPGYNNIPIGGNTVGGGVSDEDWANYWFPPDEDYGGLNGQFDYNLDDTFAGYA